MQLAYSKLAKLIKKKYKPKSILEIGSNDGVFIKHFNSWRSTLPLKTEECHGYQIQSLSRIHGFIIKP